jgi:protein-disulfide isomerase
MKMMRERVEDPKEKQDPKEDLKENLIALAIVLAICALVGWWIYSHIVAPPPAAPPVEIPIGTSPVLGLANATHTVVIFSDFECPFCGEFARDAFPAVKQLADEGKVRFVFKQFPLQNHPHSYVAAQAALCAEEQGRFWEYHDILYAHQDALTREDLESYAPAAGLNATKFQSCMSLPASRVDAERLLGQQMGVTGTPTFFFDGRKVVGALSTEEFIKELG